MFLNVLIKLGCRLGTQGTTRPQFSFSYTPLRKDLLLEMAPPTKTTLQGWSSRILPLENCCFATSGPTTTQRSTATFSRVASTWNNKIKNKMRNQGTKKGELRKQKILRKKVTMKMRTKRMTILLKKRKTKCPITLTLFRKLITSQNSPR